MASKKGRVMRMTEDSAVEEEDVTRIPLQAILLADDFATKFHPITLQRPKVLLPLTKQVIEHLGNSQWFNQPNFSVKTIQSNGSVGAGDALRLIYEHSVIRGDFILVSGDTISNIPLKDAVKEHRERRKKENNAIMTVVVSPASSTYQSRLGTEYLLMAIDPGLAISQEMTPLAKTLFEGGRFLWCLMSNFSELTPLQQLSSRGRGYTEDQELNWQALLGLVFLLSEIIVCDGVVIKSGGILEPGVVLSYNVVVGQNFVVPASSKVSLYQQPNIRHNNSDCADPSLLRLSFNLEARDCAGALFYSIMKLALTMGHVSRGELLKNVARLLVKWWKVLTHYIPSIDEEVEVIAKFQEMCLAESTKEEYSQMFLDILILHLLYEKDIVKEEAILTWASEEEGADESHQVLFKQAQTFIRWLEEASDEGEDGD
ncbi:OLC1v1031824C1 [Oldenlandia corymbosa var. corymbosa]|uniref:Translation initiation factor eIF2B subunit epsilon n=1 Tax=Oldenlandia corymbosa var. corymbosa TaxID=529605 RepID=A0AAV1CMA0_OLDCO|nr:OLC1v1031824C1 [Oldenlandia corymbosa var. corymbosa]